MVFAHPSNRVYLMKPADLHFETFIAEDITVHFDSPPAFSRKPHCPDRFTWGAQTFTVNKCLSEWKDYRRRGRMARNMQPQHAKVASQRGSWGVGRFYFEVQTECGRFFRLYYDRAPEDAFDRSGYWILLAELKKAED